MEYGRNNRKFTSARRLDFIYDPVYLVSCKRDHMRAAMTALMTSGEIGIQPTYRFMFSDCPRFPRNRYSILDSRAPQAIDPSWEGRKKRDSEPMCVRPLDVKGADRFRFHEPPSQLFLKLVKEPLFIPPKEPPEPPEYIEKTYCSVEVQTAWRESSAQTHPWDPGYKIRPGTRPELMTLGWLAWKKGLPIGMNGIELIHRARSCRLWEERIYMNTKLSRHQCNRMLEVLENEQFKSRARELQKIQNYRLKLVIEIYEQRREKFRDFQQRRIDHAWEKNKMYRDRKRLQIKLFTQRAIRKLGYEKNDVIHRFPTSNVYAELISPCAEGYAPLLRNGLHPKRIHAILHKKRMFQPNYAAFYGFSTLPDLTEFETPVRIYPDHALEVGVLPELWTDEGLEAIQEEVIRIASGLTRPKRKKSFCTKLLTRIKKPPKALPTPEVTRVSEADEDDYQSLTLILRLVKGRAIHGLMFNGRATAMETITELRSTHNPLLDRVKSRRVVGKQKRYQLGVIHGLLMIKQPAMFVEASSLGQMVELLHKEVLRLEDEQTTYGLRRLAKRTRWKREAWEAGHRQIEENRRIESDFVYRMDHLKIHQDVGDMFLEDIVIEGIENLSDIEAKKYVKQLAVKVDAAASEAMESYTELDEVTMISECVHQFIAPEVEKRNVRDVLKQRQTKHLELAHDLVFTTMNQLQKLGFKAGMPGAMEVLAESKEALGIVHRIESELLKSAVGTSAKEDLSIIREIQSELLRFNTSPADTDAEDAEPKLIDLLPAKKKGASVKIKTTEEVFEDVPLPEKTGRYLPKLHIFSDTEVKASKVGKGRPKSALKYNTPKTPSVSDEDK